ncbi:MAG: SlyX family protein [Spirochaetales bacterium]|nr:SlyX family protein [Spirochaetales bacterium]
MEKEIKRITSLEITSAYQEDMIKQLNQVVFAQQKQLEELGVALKKLSSRIKEIEDAGGDGNSHMTEKPPHY